MKTLKSSIKHPSHPIPKKVDVSIRNIHKEELAVRDRQDEMVKLARPNDKERRLLIDVQESAAHARGISADMVKKLREVESRKFNRVVHALESRVPIKKLYDQVILDDKPAQPPPTDPTFWWARTDWWLTGGIGANAREDGLHFAGGVSRHNGDLHTESFGAVALFELQAQRIPMSLSGLWRSTPHVELFGGLLGRTGDPDIFRGDCGL